MPERVHVWPTHGGWAGIAELRLWRSCAPEAVLGRAACQRALFWLLGPQEQRGGRASGDNSGEYGCEVGEQYRAERDRSDV